MDKREEILRECDKETDGCCWNGEGDLIAYDGPIQTIWNAMDENGKLMCMDLLEYMAKNNIECYISENKPVFKQNIYPGWETLNKEQIFENFL